MSVIIAFTHSTAFLAGGGTGKDYRMQTQRRVTLPKNIAGIHLRIAEDGKSRLGCVSSIPEGAELRVCGSGFNTRTVEVDWNGHFYFVFLQDIESPEKTTSANKAGIPVGERASKP